MKPISISKSFLSGAAVALFIIVAVFAINEFNNSDVKQSDSQIIQANTNQRLIPAHKVNYVPPQVIDFTNAAEKSVDAVVHIKTRINSRTNSYDDFFGQFREYFHQYPQPRNGYVAFGSGVIISEDG